MEIPEKGNKFTIWVQPHWKKVCNSEVSESPPKFHKHRTMMEKRREPQMLFSSAETSNCHKNWSGHTNFGHARGSL